jgi:hypothetical protein
MSLEKVPAHVIALAATIKEGINFDAEGVGSIADNVFEVALPEGLDLDTVKKVQDTVLDFADATALALGEAGMEHMNVQKDLKSVSLKVKAGRDSVSTEFARAVERRNPATNETFTKYGVVSTKLSSGVGAGRGNYKRIVDSLSERAAGVFAQ